MQLFINKDRGSNFANYYIPKLIRNLYLGYLTKIQSRDIESYIEKNYKITILELYKNILIYLNTRLVGNNYIIEFDKNRKYKSYNFIELINIIDNGNIEVKGVDVSRRIFSYLSNNLNYFYTSYKVSLMKGD